MLYYLLVKDYIVASFRIERPKYNLVIQFEDINNDAMLPTGIKSGYYTLQSWLESRYILTYKRDCIDFFKSLGVVDLEDFIDITHCTSLNDCFWVKSYSSKATWNKVSLYRNSFNEVISNYSFTGRVNGKNIGSSPDFSTDGTFPKCWRRYNNEIFLIKGGSSGACNAGLEPFSEVFACQLADYLDIPIIHQSYLKYKGSDASKCKCICDETTGIVKLNELYNKNNADFRWLKSVFGSKISSMFLMDYLLCNTDRHFGNIWLYLGINTNRVVNFTELCDNNLSCIPYYMSSESLESYINDIRAKDGSTWLELLSLVDKSIVRYYLTKAKGFRFKKLGIKKADERIDILNGMLQYQVKVGLGS